MLDACSVCGFHWDIKFNALKSYTTTFGGVSYSFVNMHILEKPLQWTA